MTKILLTDNSHWEGSIDWAKAASAMGGCINKASEHVSWVDDQWAPNKAGCISQGEPYGGYHFFRPSYDPIAQAQHHLRTVGAGVRVYACDVESSIMALYKAKHPTISELGISTPPRMAALPMPSAQFTKDIHDIIEQELSILKLTYKKVGMVGSAPLTSLSLPQLVEQFLDYVIVQVPGCRPVFYSSPYFWMEHMKYADGTYPNWNGKYFLWIAHYYVNEPQLPAPWTDYLIHQYTDKLSIPGIPSMTDGDWYKGTQEEVNTFFGNIGSNPPTPPVPTLPDKVYINTGSLNIRSSPDARLQNIIGSTPINKIWNPIALVSGFDLSGKPAEYWQINKYAYIAKWLTRL